MLRLTPGAAAEIRQHRGGRLAGSDIDSDDSDAGAGSEGRSKARCRPLDFTAPANGDGDISLWLAIAFAVLGGLILNVMPCVLPILAMKALSLASHGSVTGAAKAFPMPPARCCPLPCWAWPLCCCAPAAPPSAGAFQLQNRLSRWRALRSWYSRWASTCRACLKWAVSRRASGLAGRGGLGGRLLHRRAGGGGGRALYRAFHGGGAGLCPDSRRSYRRWRCSWRWVSAFALPFLLLRHLAARFGLYSQARPLDADFQAVLGLSLCMPPPPGWSGCWRRKPVPRGVVMVLGSP